MRRRTCGRRESANKSASRPATSMAPPPPLDVVACCGTCTAWIVTDAEALRDGSWFETAVTVTTAGVGTLAGAVYTPVAVMVPRTVLPPATPSTCQVTVWSAALVTVAVNVRLLLGKTLVVVGDTLTPIDAQPSELAVPGVVVAPVGVTMTSARSVRPASSVTASRSVNESFAGTSARATADRRRRSDLQQPCSEVRTA